MLAHRYLLLLILVAAGCGASHGREDPAGETADAGAREPDAWREAPRDGGVPPEGESCHRSGGGPLTVRVEAITTIRPERCTYGAIDGRLYAVEPAGDGVRLSVDLCPLADDDCRCAIVVGAIGADLADRVIAPMNVRGRVDPQLVFLEQSDTPCDACVDCWCPAPVALYAADGHPDAPPAIPSAVSFATGEEVCRTEWSAGDCGSARHRLRMIENTGPLAVVPEMVEVDEGDEARLTRTNIFIRNRRSTETWCPDWERIPPLPGPTAFWVAWSEMVVTADR